MVYLGLAFLLDVDVDLVVDFRFEPDLRVDFFGRTGGSGFWKERSDLAIRLRLSRTVGGNRR